MSISPAPGSAIFVDRDGVLNVEGGKHVLRPEDLRILPGSLEAVAQLKQAGWKVFVYTNQSGVGRGLMTVADLDAIHTRLQTLAAEAGGHFDGIYACIHAPEAGCECRKPLPGLILSAANEHQLDLKQCIAIGDSPRDIAAGTAAGCCTFLVLSGHTKTYDPQTFPTPQPDAVFPNLAAAVQTILHS